MDPFQQFHTNAGYESFANYREHEVPLSAPTPAGNMNMFQHMVAMGHQENAADGFADYESAQGFQGFDPGFQGYDPPAFQTFGQDNAISGQEDGRQEFALGFQGSAPAAFETFGQDQAILCQNNGFQGSSPVFQGSASTAFEMFRQDQAISGQQDGFQASAPSAFELFLQDQTISSQEDGGIANGRSEVAFQTPEPNINMSQPGNAAHSNITNNSNDRNVGRFEEIAYIRAKPGKATRLHSLQERERRQIVRQKMALLESIVPGCQKIEGTQLEILNYIINYVETIPHNIKILTKQINGISRKLHNQADVSFMETAVGNNGSPVSRSGSIVNNTGMTFHSQSNGNMNASDNNTHPVYPGVHCPVQGF